MSIGAFMLLCAVGTQALVQIGLEALQREIGLISDYKFTILSGFTATDMIMQAGDLIQTAFPIDVPILDLTAPTSCYRIDSSGASHSLTDCKVNPGNMISFTLDETLNTLSNPLVYVLGQAKNPDCVKVTASFKISQYRQGALVDARESGLTATYRPGTLTGLSLSASTLVVYTEATYTVTFVPEHTVPQSGKLRIVFPTSDFQLGGVTSVSVSGRINSSAPLILTPTEPSPNVLVASGLFDSEAVSAASAPVITVTVYPVTNPDSMRTSLSLTVYTTTSEGCYIDMGDSGMKVTPNAPKSISINGLSATPPTVLLPAMYSFNVSPELSFPSTGKITVAIPSSIVIGSVSCSFVLGFGSSTGTCVVTDQTISSVGVSFTQSKDNRFIAFTISGLTNPPNTLTTGNFQLSTYDAGGFLMCRNLMTFALNAAPNVLTVNAATRRAAAVAADGPYTLTFTLATAIPQFAKIKIVLPNDQVSAYSLSCHIVSGSVVLPTDVCAASLTVTASSYSFAIEEWCSSSAAGCPKGTKLSLSFSGVRNLPYIKTPVASSVEIYTMNSQMTGTIDAISAGVSFSPALAIETLDGPSIVRTGDVVGQNTAFTVQFSPTIDFVPGCVVVLSLPAGVAFADDSGGNLQATVSSVATNIASATFNTDTSLKSVSFDRLCLSGCPAHSPLSLTVSGLDNPRQVQPLSAAYSLSVYALPNYQVAASSVDASGVDALLPDAVTGILVARSSHSIQTSAQVEVAFLHATAVATDTLIQLTLPDNLLTVGSGLVCQRKSDGATLQCSGTQYDSGAYSSLTVSNYCSLACPKATLVQLLFKGLSTPSSVVPVTGQLAVVTTYQTYTVDTGLLADVSTQLPPLQPGALRNLAIDPDDPTVAATTAYRLVFTTTHSIPAGAVVVVTFPAEIAVADRSLVDGLCSVYLKVESTMQCSAASGKVYVKSGFVTALQGSWMAGFLLAKVTNPTSALTSNPVQVEIQTAEGHTVDSGTASVSFYAAQGSCATQCRLCSGTTTNCSACLYPGLVPYSRTGTCVSECPPNTFLVSTPLPHACITCHFTCASCTSGLSTECVNCAVGYVKSNRSCVGSCPAATIAVEGVCVNQGTCTAPCLTCSSSLAFCLSCNTASAFPVLDSVNGKCVQPQSGQTHYCPDGYFQSGFACVPCDKSCAKCVSTAGLCTACKSIYGTPLLNLIDNTCVSDCPPGITTLQGGRCVPCDPSCSTCSAPAATACLTCPTSGTKYKTSGGACVTQCPQGTYHFDESDGSFSCISVCATTAKFFIESATTYCVPCYEACLTCSGASNQQCLSCDETSSLPFFTADGQCTSSCPATQFSYTLGGAHLCYISCPPPSLNFLDSGKKTCIATCASAHFFIDSANNLCSPCDATCFTCQGSGPSQCLSCDSQSPTPYLSDGGQCLQNCGSDLFLYTVAGAMKCYSMCPTGTYNLDSAGGKVCTTSCDSGSWVDVSSNYCRACYSHCKTCTGGTNKSCTSCDQSGSFPFFTDDGQCVASCPSDLYRYTLNSAMRCVATCPDSTFFSVGSDGTVSCIAACDGGSKLYVDAARYCRPCDSSCLTCTSAASCTTCDLQSANSFLIDGGLCVANCPATLFESTVSGTRKCYSGCPPPLYNFVDGGKQVCASICASQKFYVNTSTNFCSPCDPSCLTCSGPSAFNCVTCDPSGSTPLPTADNQCVSACPSAMFLYSLNNSPRCYTTCPAGTFYYKGADVPRCIDSCGDGYYLEVATRTCFQCNSQCKTCIGVTATSCTTCDVSSTLPFLTDSRTCVENCGTMFKYTLSGSLKCYTKCPADSYNFVDPATGEKLCITLCGVGFFVDSPENFCRQCDSTCRTCSSSLSTSCLTCPSAFPFFSDSGQCVSQCSPSSYTSTLNGTQRCYTSCPNGSYNFDSAAGKVCTALCGPGFYVDAPSNYCRPCFGACLTCNGVTSTSCLTCDKSGSNPYLADTGDCVAQCGTLSPYVYTANGDMKCFAVCPAGFYMYDDGRGGNLKCVATCTAGNFLDSTNKYCRKCDISCASCNGTSASSCLACDTTGTTPYLTESSQCVSQCPATTYRYDLDGARKCYLRCPSGSFGLKDASGTLLCVSACGPGFYLDSDSNNCHICSATCRTCRGVTATDCLSCDKSSSHSYLTDAGQCVASCPSSLFLYSPNSEKRCVATCPAGSYNSDNPAGFGECVFACSTGFFVDEENNYCKACAPSCRTCSNGTTCVTCNKTGPTPLITDDQRCVSECPANMYLYSPNGEQKCVVACPSGSYAFPATKTCIASCGDGYFVNAADNSCQKCYQTCRTCTSATSQACTACDGTRPFLTEVGECVSQCPSQYFTLKSQQQCVSLCPPELFSSVLTSGKECTATCGAGFYIEQGSNVCRPCAASCLTCSGGASSQCTSCSSVSSFPYLSSDGQCVSLCSSTQYAYTSGGVTKCLQTCPSGTFYLDSPSKQCTDACPLGTYVAGASCAKCDQSCTKCSGPGSSECLSCRPELAYFKSACLVTCPQGYRNANGFCTVACDQSSCNQCKWGTAEKCDQCAPGFILYKDRCYDACPEGTFGRNETCAVCDQQCRSCSGDRSDQCTSCPVTSNLYLGKCLSSCPAGLESVSGRCQVPVPCESPCRECIQGTADLCTSCQADSPLLVGTTCVAECPEDHYSAGSACALCDETCESCEAAADHCTACRNSTFLTANSTCEAECPLGFVASNLTNTCIEDPSVVEPLYRASSTRQSTYAPVTVHIGLLSLCAAAAVVSKLYRPDMHITEANALALLSGVDMVHRLSLLVTLWQYAAVPNSFEIGVSAGLLIGSATLSMMFLLLYLDPVVESSAAFELFVSQHKWSYGLLRVACYLFGVHFVRLLYGGLFGLEVLSNFKTLGSSSAFRLPLERLCAIQAAAMLLPQVVQNATVMVLYASDSDPFQLAAFGIPVNVLLLGVFLYDYLRGPWR